MAERKREMLEARRLPRGMLVTMPPSTPLLGVGVSAGGAPVDGMKDPARRESLVRSRAEHRAEFELRKQKWLVSRTVSHY